MANLSKSNTVKWRFIRMLKKFPKIKDPDTFELLARDTLQVKLNITLSLYGRTGQAQNGIDLYTSGENKIVVQCKDYLSDKSPTEISSIILNELGKTQKLDFPFKQFWLATALERDTNIQNIVETLQNNSVRTIYIFFWDDIEEILSYNGNIALHYYPEYCGMNENYSSLICLGFFSIVFTDYIDMMRFERTPALSYCYMIENGLNWVFNPNTRENLQICLAEIKKYLTGSLNLTIDFKQENAFYWCQDVQRNINSISYSLSQNYLIYFRIGIALGKLDHVLSSNTNKGSNERYINELKQLLSSLNLTTNQSKVIQDYLKNLDIENQKYRIPTLIFDYLCNIV